MKKCTKTKYFLKICTKMYIKYTIAIAKIII